VDKKGLLPDWKKSSSYVQSLLLSLSSCRSELGPQLQGLHIRKDYACFFGDTEGADWFSSRLIVNPDFVPKHQCRTSEVVSILTLMRELEPGLADLVVRENGHTHINILFDEGKLFFNKIPIDKLATGHVAIIKIFQEIVAGYGGWTSMVDDSADLGNVEGLVFIDEIESHLHPRWQYEIIPLLKRFFPKTTFFIATHSPTVISSTGQGEGYELRREGDNVTAEKLGNLQGLWIRKDYM